MDYGDQDDGQGWDGSDNDICGCGDTPETLDEDCPMYAKHVEEM